MVGTYMCSVNIEGGEKRWKNGRKKKEEKVKFISVYTSALTILVSINGLF